MFAFDARRLGLKGTVGGRNHGLIYVCIGGVIEIKLYRRVYLRISFPNLSTNMMDGRMRIYMCIGIWCVRIRSEIGNGDGKGGRCCIYVYVHM